MAELRPAAEVVEDIVRAQGMAPKIAVLQADRVVTVEKVRSDVGPAIQDALGGECSALDEISRVIRAVAQTPDTEREQLAKALYARKQRNTPWIDITEEFRKVWRKDAAFAITELDKIREESDA